MGVLSKVLGLIFTSIGMAILFFGGTSDPIISTISLFIGMLIITIGLGLLNVGRQVKSRKPKPPTVTEIKCENGDCDFREIRNFERGDYILKTLQVRCPKCESPLTIQGIYIVKEENETEKQRI